MPYKNAFISITQGYWIDPCFLSEDFKRRISENDISDDELVNKYGAKSSHYEGDAWKQDWYANKKILTPELKLHLKGRPLKQIKSVIRCVMHQGRDNFIAIYRRDHIDGRQPDIELSFRQIYIGVLPDGSRHS